MSNKADEVRNTPRNQLGSLCVWPDESRISYVFVNKCYLLFLNKQGNYTEKEIESLLELLKIEFSNSNI